MKSLKARILLSSLAAVISTLVFLHPVAKAADCDFYDTKNGIAYRAAEYQSSIKLFNELVLALDSRGSDFVYERGAKGYSYQKLYDSVGAKYAGGKAINTAFSEALADTTLVVAIPVVNEGDLDIIDIQ